MDSTNLIPPSATRKNSASRFEPTLARGPVRNMSSHSSFNDSPYSAIPTRRFPTSSSLGPSIAGKFSLSPDPAAWGADLSLHNAEPDDYLHNPDPRRDCKNDNGGSFLTGRGLSNLGCLLLLGVGLLTLFAGYPMITYFTKHTLSFRGGFNLGGINATGQVPKMSGNWGLIDVETPEDAYTYPSFRDGETLQLVFSDEFNTDGRTFYPGDDPFWEAVDLHYWGTNNMEWYDPAAITTKGGSLHVTLSQKENHDLKYQGGMMSTWNKFCFTGGLIVTSVVLPGVSNVVGLWPAIWTMGNLGEYPSLVSVSRAGYGASLEGMWPYTYDACDVGTAPNQTINGLPYAATVNGDQGAGGVLSYLPGQRLSRCTCPGESHPGPVHADGTYVGRAAPEIDIFEAQVGGDFGTPNTGEVSQSGQWAPFNEAYRWFNTTDNLIIPDPDVTIMNSYLGGALQQASSCITKTNPDAYFGSAQVYETYGFEYKPGYDDAVSLLLHFPTPSNDFPDTKTSLTVHYMDCQCQGAWTAKAAGFAADTGVEISARPIPQEPMYLIVNLGMSTNFGTVDLERLVFPTTMMVDWIRVYQRKGSINIGCDPKNFPTKAYIDEYIEAYTNPNLTTWKQAGQTPPRNKLIDGCN
ncbi:hypothetical protein D9758_000440 [Tetrapyrgos nigripes]|uniref:GH16 domain-containing protein n=1 Tax=Tetrapyrgos nigripes TaxID=182062 RepID=A0A8H5H1N5_9AGAR|nr:hypothetical protein D9758_000440 [Tetrapyrgos nigripes]